jgi:hypothetical protein
MLSQDQLMNSSNPVFTYTLASADLRYIEVGERALFFRQDPEKGLIICGETPGSGPHSKINLSQVLLEYSMSCEGCSRPELADEMVRYMGRHVGQTIAEKMIQVYGSLSPEEQLSNAMKILLNSMGTTFTEQAHPSKLEYSLECCPLSECARNTGLNRNVELAYFAFLTLLVRLIEGITSHWKLVRPSSDEVNIPLHNILITA